MILVAGFSGIGKTAVVNEVHKPIVKNRGYFIKGKFDQFNRNIPLSAFVQAFRDLMGQILSESDAELTDWKTKILEAVGPNGQVLIDTIPELERVIGKQPSVPKLSGSAVQNRFNLLFEKFIAVFTTPEHPLVMFLDDLQWADSASLNLMKVLMGDKDRGYLLLLGAYRDNEVFPTHPLMMSLDEIQKQDANLHTLTLEPLSALDINHLGADTLLCKREVAEPLSKLVYQKTQGNPFFTTQFLRGLYEEGCITFNLDAGYWQCNLPQVQQLALTDDVVEFMVRRLRKLPQVTQNVLKIAACIGNQFDLNTLAVVCESSPEEIATNLWRALQEGLIIPENKTYKFFQGDVGEVFTLENREVDTGANITVKYRFLHDRVQQATYSLIPDDEKQITHLKIGQLLLQNTSLQEQEQNLFNIVNQLNIGIPLIKDPKELEQLADRNLAAAQKAKASVAYDAACKYLEIALDFMGTDAWQTHYSLILQLSTLLAETYYLSGQFTVAEQQVELVLQHAQNLLDRLKANEIRMQLLIVQNQYQAALDLGLEMLALLEIPIEDTPLPSIDIERLYTLHSLKDVRILAALSVLSQLWAPALIANPKLLPQIIVTMLNLSVTHGNSAIGAFAYSLYGMLLCATAEDLDLGYRFGTLAMNVLEQYENAEFTCKVNQLFHAFIRNWKERARDRIEFLARNVQTGLETGEIQFASYSAINYCDNLCLVGETLGIVRQKQDYYIQLLYSLKQDLSYFSASVWGQFVDNLMGDALEPQQLIGKRFDEEQQLAELEADNSFTTLFFFYTTKTILHYLFDNYESVLKSADLAAQYEQAGSGLLPITQIPFYRALALLSLCSIADSARSIQQLAEVDQQQQRLNLWATHAPENFQHKVDLVEAEKCRIKEQKLDAIELYDRAIAGAKANEYIQEEALANELAAKFYLDWDKERVAAGYMQEAYYCYARWGAKAKTDHLEANYPQLLAPILQKQQTELNLLDRLSTLSQSITGTFQTQSSTNISEAFDFATILQAAQKLSSTIELDQLLKEIAQIILTNAGGQKIALLAFREHQWQIQASAALTNDGTVVTDTSGEFLTPESPVPIRLIQYVKNTQTPVLIDEAQTDITGILEGYLLKYQPQSVFCLPLLDRGELVAIVYLEHPTTKGVFTSNRQTIIEFLCAQAAVAWQNALLYNQAQQSQRKAEQTLEELQQAQIQLVQSEKMSALGNLVAGVAHEINNPVGFLQGNIQPAQEYVQDLLGLIDLYQQKMSHADEEIEEEIEQMDLEFIREDFPRLLDSMNLGVERIRNISNSLRTFSRTDKEQKIYFNIHEGIDSTLLILKHRTKANEQRPKIEVFKEYDDLPEVECFPGQINQVFMNIIANAIDAFEEANQGKTYQEIEAHPNAIAIRTSRDDFSVQIEIQDNGCGMKPETRERIFDQGFTTKEVGKGTGLGMAIAHQIIAEKHSGKITCTSELNQGTTFTITLPLE